MSVPGPTNETIKELARQAFGERNEAHAQNVTEWARSKGLFKGQSKDPIQPSPDQTMNRLEILEAARSAGSEQSMNCPDCQTPLEPVLYSNGVGAECPKCSWSQEVSDKHIILGALASYKDKQDNYDGPPDDSDAWSGGFAENH